MSPAWARTSARLTRMNCRMWGSSPVTVVIREDPQPSESAGSFRHQAMWEPSSPESRTFRLSYITARRISSL